MRLSPEQTHAIVAATRAVAGDRKVDVLLVDPQTRLQPVHREAQSQGVLLSIAEYPRTTGGQQNIADLLAMPTAEELELDVPRLSDLARPADMS